MLKNPVLLHRISIVLAVLGIGVAGYLTWVHFTASKIAFCLTGTGCETVQNSPFSTVQGIPVAIIGMLGYAAILVVLGLELSSKWFKERGPILVFGMSLVGFLYAAYLTYVSKFLIGAFCSWCLLNTALITLLFIVSIVRVIVGLEEI